MSLTRSFLLVHPVLKVANEDGKVGTYGEATLEEATEDMVEK